MSSKMSFYFLHGWVFSSRLTLGLNIFAQGGTGRLIIHENVEDSPGD